LLKETSNYCFNRNHQQHQQQQRQHQQPNPLRTRHRLRTVKQQFLTIRNSIENLNLLFNTQLLLIVRGNSVIATTDFQPGDITLDITPLTNELWESHYAIDIGLLCAPLSTSQPTSPPSIKRSRSRVTTPASVTSVYPPAPPTTPADHQSPIDLLAQAANEIEKSAWTNVSASAGSSAVFVTNSNIVTPIHTPPVGTAHLSWTSLEPSSSSTPGPSSSSNPGPSSHFVSANAPLPEFNSTFNRQSPPPATSQLLCHPEPTTSNVYQDLAYFLQQHWPPSGAAAAAAASATTVAIAGTTTTTGEDEEGIKTGSVEATRKSLDHLAKTEVLSLGESAGSLSVKALNKRIDRLQSLIFELITKVNAPSSTPPPL
jgi:hypothetical protein